MLDIANMIDTLERYVKERVIKQHYPLTSLVTCLLEQNTIGLRLPRQSGKTKFLLDKFVSAESLLVVPNTERKISTTLKVRSQLRSMIVVAESEYLYEKFIGTNQSILQYVLFDEVISQTTQVNVLSQLQNLKMIDHTTIIISLHT